MARQLPAACRQRTSEASLAAARPLPALALAGSANSDLGEVAAVGYPMNYHVTGSVRLGHTAERLLEFKRVAGMGRYQGMDLTVLAPDEIRSKYPFLETHDLTGALTLWIECGEVPMRRFAKALGRSKTARFVCVFAHLEDAQQFVRSLKAERPRHTDNLEIWLIPAEFVAWLESVGKRNMVWTATITEGTRFLDCDGHSGECQPQRLQLL